MPKTDVAAERAARLIEALRRHKEQGADYPPTVGRLRELADPEATDEELFKALAKAGEAVALAAKKDAAAPVALAEDAEPLARGESLLLYALTKLAGAERPLHPPAKLVAKVDKAVQPAFEAALAERLAAGALPPGVGKHEAKGKVQLYLNQFPPPPPPAPKKSPEQELAERVIAALASRREEGAAPVSLRQLAARLDPPPPDEALAKLAKHKALKGQVVFAVPGDPDAPAVRPGDEDRLAQSPEVARYAVGLLSTAEQPLHPLGKVAARLDKALRPAFEASVREQIASRALPAEVVAHATGDKIALRLARHELPLAADETLAGRLLAILQNEGAPLPREAWLSRAEGAPPKVLKAALARLRDQVTEAGGLVAPAADRARLLGDPGLLRRAIEAAVTDADRAVPITGLGRKLGREHQGDFEQTVEAAAREGRLPEGVGCLWVKGRALVFLTADIGRWPAPVVEPAPAAPESDFGRLFDQAYERLAREQPSAAVSVGELRQEVALGGDRFDSELERLCQTGRYALSGEEAQYVSRSDV